MSADEPRTGRRRLRAGAGRPGRTRRRHVAVRDPRHAATDLGARGLDLVREPGLRSGDRIARCAVHEPDARRRLRARDERAQRNASQSAELPRADVGPAAGPAGTMEARLQRGGSVSHARPEPVRAGSSWGAYAESMPKPCVHFFTGPYAASHNPAVYYRTLADCDARDV